MERKQTLSVCNNEESSQNTNITKFNVSKSKEMKCLNILSVVALSLLTPILSFAQSTETVLPVIVSGKDSTWYAQQAKAWEQEVQKSPKSEEAWRNLANAKYYLKYWFNENVTPADSSGYVLNRMEKAIPGTFTYNYCRYKANQGGQSDFADKALDMIPADIDPGTVDGLLGYLWRCGAADGVGKRAQQFDELLRRQYHSAYYPDYVLRYSYNQLEGLPENAIYIGRGDMDLFPKVMMQRAMRVHQDKMIVVSSFICIKEYTDSICKRLGIAPYIPAVNPVGSSANDDINAVEFIKYLSQNTGRPIYCEASLVDSYRLIANNLYREGLLLKYSPVPYDNWAAAKKVIHKYHYEYLYLPKFRPETYWKGSEMIQANYVVMLAEYIKKYKQMGNTAKADWLKQILETSVVNTQLPESTKATYLEYLKQFCP